MAEISLYNASDLDREEWRTMQSLSREGFKTTLRRTKDEIDALVLWDDPEKYYLSHIDPNSEVGNRFNAAQAFSKPRVAVAVEAGEPVGFAYSADNVSGDTELVRIAKWASVVKRYSWLRDIAVRPDMQRQGIAKELGKSLLHDALAMQPVTAYIWPDEIPPLHTALERLGFTPTVEQNVQLFSEGSEPVRQVRMQAASASHVLRCIG